MEKTGLRGQIWELQDECRDVLVESLEGMIEVVAFVKWSLDLAQQLLESGHALGMKQQKLCIVQEAVSDAQHSTLAKIEKARECHAQLEDDEEWLGCAHDDAYGTQEEVFETCSFLRKALEEKAATETKKRLKDFGPITRLRRELKLLNMRNEVLTAALILLRANAAMVDSLDTGFKRCHKEVASVMMVIAKHAD